MIHSITMKNVPLLAAPLILALLFGGGCTSQNKPDGLPPLYPLVVKLTQDGVPLTEASIFLFAEDGPATWTIGGTTDAAGNVSPVTHGKYPGVPAGKYKVCVFKVESVPKPEPARPDEFDLVDIKLKSPATTTLILEVTPGKNNVTLDVGKPIRQRINSGGA